MPQEIIVIAAIEVVVSPECLVGFAAHPKNLVTHRRHSVVARRAIW